MPRLNRYGYKKKGAKKLIFAPSNYVMLIFYSGLCIAIYIVLPLYVPLPIYLIQGHEVISTRAMLPITLGQFYTLTFAN
jgi:hypothetical protein